MPTPIPNTPFEEIIRAELTAKFLIRKENCSQSKGVFNTMNNGLIGVDGKITSTPQCKLVQSTQAGGPPCSTHKFNGSKKKRKLSHPFSVKRTKVVSVRVNHVIRKAAPLIEQAKKIARTRKEFSVYLDNLTNLFEFFIKYPFLGKSPEPG